MALTVPYTLVEFDDSSPSRWTFQSSENTATVTYRIKYDDCEDAVRGLLGYGSKIDAVTFDDEDEEAEADPMSLFTHLSRELPERHPSWPQMVCVAISEMRPMGPGLSAPAFGGKTFDKTTKMEITALFRTVPYKVLPDKFGMKEYERFTERRIIPALDVASIERNVYRVIYPPVIPGGLPGLEGLSAPVTFPMRKLTLEWTWHCVPHNYLFNEFEVPPTSWLNCFGCVNDFAWNGFERGTLLCLPPEIENEYEVPFAEFLPDDLRTQHKVKFRFKYFEPPADPLANLDSLPTRGHNLVPSRKANDPYWRLITRISNNPQDDRGWMMQEANFNRLFDPWLD